MNILFTDDAWEDYLYWQQTDKQTLRKINQLLKEIQRTPFAGIGKPEPLKHQLQGCSGRDALIANIVWFMKLPIICLKLLAAAFIINTFL
jgi:Txe/YoeB family toxin of toxin-antitoxin system